MCGLEKVGFHVGLHAGPPAVLTAPALRGMDGEISQHTPSSGGTCVFLPVQSHSDPPAALHGRCRCRWHPGIPSATGFQPGTFCHRRNMLTHLGEKVGEATY